MIMMLSVWLIGLLFFFLIWLEINSKEREGCRITTLRQRRTLQHSAKPTGEYGRARDGRWRWRHLLACL